MSSNMTKRLIVYPNFFLEQKKKKKKKTIKVAPSRLTRQISRRKIKKTFAEAAIERIKKLRKKLNLEKKRRTEKNGCFFENEILNEKKFKFLKKHIQNEEIKINKEMSFKNRIRLPRRRN